MPVSNLVVQVCPYITIFYSENLNERDKLRTESKTERIIIKQEVLGITNRLLSLSTTRTAWKKTRATII
jgi:hypothetical protein